MVAGRPQFLRVVRLKAFSWLLAFPKVSFLQKWARDRDRAIKALQKWARDRDRAIKVAAIAPIYNLLSKAHTITSALFRWLEKSHQVLLHL